METVNLLPLQTQGVIVRKINKEKGMIALLPSGEIGSVYENRIVSLLEKNDISHHYLSQSIINVMAVDEKHMFNRMKTLMQEAVEEIQDICLVEERVAVIIDGMHNIGMIDKHYLKDDTAWQIFKDFIDNLPDNAFVIGITTDVEYDFYLKGYGESLNQSFQIFQPDAEMLETMGIVQFLERERTKREMTQKALSKKSGINQSQISRIEDYQVIPSLETIVRLASALDLKIKFANK